MNPAEVLGESARREFVAERRPALGGQYQEIVPSSTRAPPAVANGIESRPGEAGTGERAVGADGKSGATTTAAYPAGAPAAAGGEVAAPSFLTLS